MTVLTWLTDFTSGHTAVSKHLRQWNTDVFMFSGSKNPQITLKLAEIRTDHLGRVSIVIFVFFYIHFIMVSTW